MSGHGSEFEWALDFCDSTVSVFCWQTYFVVGFSRPLCHHRLLRVWNKQVNVLLLIDIALFSISWTDSLRSCHMQFWISDCCFLSRSFEYPLKWCAYSAIWLPCETIAISVHILCAHTTCASLHCHFIPSHLHKVHVCLGVTCHLRINDSHFSICATPTAVAQGWSRYWNVGHYRNYPGEENSSAAPARIQTCDLSVMRQMF